MHGHRVYPDFHHVSYPNSDEVLVDNVEEPVVVASSQLSVTRNQVKVLITRLYAETASMALDYSEVIKPHKGLAAEVMLVSIETKNRFL